MKTKKILFTISGLFTVIVAVQSQEVIATSGDYFENSSGSVAFTIGEPVTATLIKDDKILTQGFHQSEITIETEYILPALEFEITAFPNPANDYVILKADQFEGLHYLLYTIEGEQIQQGLLDSDQTEINFSHFQPSVYLLRVVEGNKDLKTFKIIKK